MVRIVSVESTSTKPIALVVGFTIHGLAVARALCRAGIEVHALSADSTAATNLSRYAQVHYRPRIHEVDIVENLLAFADEYLKNRQAVLLPTNDNMVRAIGSEWSLLEDRFLLSWSECIELILKLQIKDNIPSFCQRAGVHHPKSVVVRSLNECDNLDDVSDSRLLVKPVRPLSGFKAVIINSFDELRSLISRHTADLPFIVQQYIDGEDDSLFFCAMYIVAGKELYAFTGQKIRASPPHVGQGTVMASVVNDEIVRLSRKFLAGLNLSGPIAIEYKRDMNGRYWLIEPNIGRTEYCVDLLIKSGQNLPVVEYLHATGSRASVDSTASCNAVTWYDTEKQPLCYIKHVLSTRQIYPLGHVPIFPFYGHNDTKPLLKAILNRFRTIGWGAIRKVGKMFRN